MPRSASRGKELRTFLRDSTLAYAAGEIKTKEVSPHSYVAQYEDQDFRLVDMYSTSPDERVYNGRALVFRDGERIWGAGHHGVIDVTVEPEDFLLSYAKALMHPRPELPIRGPKRSRQLGNKRRYTLGSISGPLRISDFAVEESMTQNGTRIYKGHIIGGSLENS